MYLEGKNFHAPEASVSNMTTAKRNQIKTKIRELCPKDAKWSYEDLVIALQTEYNANEEYYTNDALIAVIQEVAQEEDYTKPVEDEDEE